MLDKIYSFFGNFFYWICGGFMVDNNALGLSAADLTKITATAGTVWGDIWAAMTSVADKIFVPIATTIVCIYFFVAIIEKTSMERITAEQMIREVIKLIMGLYLVQNCTLIMTQCINIGNGLITKVQNIIKDYSMSGQMEAVESLQSGDLFKNILGAFNPLTGMMLSSVIVISLIFLAIIVVCLLVICQVRKVELMLKTAIAPIAMCDTFTGNFLNSHAINFLRSFFATCLQGCIIVVAINIIPLFGSSIINNILAIDGKDAAAMWTLMKDIFMLAVTYICVLVITFKAGNMSKEVMGAR